MKKIFSLSAYMTILMMAILTGCDTQQSAAPDNKNRVELGQNNNEKEFGDYTVHVNVLTTDQLPADVARAYKISRSKSRAMLNVVVTKNINGEHKPVTAKVTTVTRNLANQLKNLAVREIIEQDAIYYIGDLQVDNQEILIFNIDVTPKNEPRQFNLAYRQQFFTE